jgi:uncharacterized protein
MSTKLFGIFFAIAAVIGSGIYFQENLRTIFFGEPVSWVRLGGVQIFVSIADTQETRRQGLSSTTALAELEGKLFIFESLGTHGIWMKDMNYPIDIFWISDDLKIIHTEANVDPDTYPQSFSSPEPARYVLETNAGLAEQYGVRNGDSVNFSVSVDERRDQLLFQP